MSGKRTTKPETKALRFLWSFAMQGKTMNLALLALRKVAIRTGGLGLDRIKALLAFRDLDMPKVRFAKKADAVRCDRIWRWGTAVPRDGPKPRRAVA